MVCYVIGIIAIDGSVIGVLLYVSNCFRHKEDGLTLSPEAPYVVLNLPRRRHGMKRREGKYRAIGYSDDQSIAW